uniref:Uncharacterized protein n=1 Tax=Sphaerodactylus townsendi TaxID=933632 RepID=A0ACB8FZ49_9SAUR
MTDPTVARSVQRITWRNITELLAPGTALRKTGSALRLEATWPRGGTEGGPREKADEGAKPGMWGRGHTILGGGGGLRRNMPGRAGPPRRPKREQWLQRRPLGIPPPRPALRRFPQAGLRQPAAAPPPRARAWRREPQPAGPGEGARRRCRGAAPHQPGLPDRRSPAAQAEPPWVAAMGSRLSSYRSPDEGRQEAGGRRSERRPTRFPPLASLLRGSQKLSAARRSAKAAPYERRVRWIREIQATLRARQRDQALQVLRLLRKNAAFLNLVDPISHDLLMSLARDLQCPKKEYDPWKSADRICRQLIYHLTPHSIWHQHSMPRRKSQASLKNNLQKKLSQDAIDLSGIPLSTQDIHHLAYYLQNSGHNLDTVDLSFTDLNDDKMHSLLPFLWSLPKLTHLSLNGNCLTKATVKELTDVMKDMNQFPCLAWVDLGNNVDVSSMPQPLLVGLRKRLNLQTTLPTIYESLDSDSELTSSPRVGQLEDTEAAAALQAVQMQPKAEEKSCIFPQQSCER